LSTELHELIAAYCGNRFLGAALAALPVLVQRFRLFSDEGVDDVDVALGEHDAIYRSISAGDVDGARAVIADHISAVYRRTSEPL
jgi:DNA-binding FadR family transcriptional regulator